MTNDRNSLKAGTFIIVSLVLIGFVVVAISGSNRFFQPEQTRTVSFQLIDDIGGLRIGDDVRIGGYKVGEVRTIDVDDHPNGTPTTRVIVTFQIPRKYVLRKDARISIQSTVTGTSNLNFDDLGSGPALAENEQLVGNPGTITELLDKVHELEPHITSIVANADTKTLPLINADLAKFGKTADEVTEQIHPVVEHYNTVADHGTQMMDQIRDLIGDTKTDFRGTIANLNASTATIKDKLPRILDEATDVLKVVDEKVATAGAALDDIRATVANTRDISAQAREIVGGNRGKIDGMISSLKATGDNLKNASAEIRRSPWRLLYKPGPGEMANLNLYDSARQFADGANNLNDAAEALRDALKNGNPDKAQVQKLMDQLDQSFSNFKEVEDKLWTSVKE